MSPELQPGLRFEWRYTVPPRATVPELYHDTPFCRDMPDVLATGYMVGMMELACLNGMLPYLDWPNEQSLGTMVSFRHLAPTPPGMTLTIRGEVTEVEDQRVRFKVEAEGYQAVPVRQRPDAASRMQRAHEIAQREE